MLIENDFSVDASQDEVFALLLDVERVAPCIPGTEVLGRRSNGSYDGQMNVRLGPLKMCYRGTVVIAERDAAARTATMVAKGIESRGQGSAQGVMKMAVRGADGGGAHVSISTDLKMTGRVAQMGGGAVKDVSMRLIAEMAENMERQLAAAIPSNGAQADDATNVEVEPRSSPATSSAAASARFSPRCAAGAHLPRERWIPRV
jgi:uncharacterized protein